MSLVSGGSLQKIGIAWPHLGHLNW